MVTKKTGHGEKPAGSARLALCGCVPPLSAHMVTLTVPGLPAQTAAVRMRGFYNIMGLNERSLTPTFNYNLEKVLVKELKQRSARGKMCDQIFRV